MTSQTKFIPLTGIIMAFMTATFAQAQAEIVMISRVGTTSDHQNRWHMPHRGLNSTQMKQALNHLNANTILLPTAMDSSFFFNLWGEFEADFNLIDALVPSFGGATVEIGAQHRLSQPRHLDNKATYREHDLRRPFASFAGFKFIETLRYSSEHGLSKQVHRVFPMETSYLNASVDNEEAIGTSAIGICDCGESKYARIKPSKVFFHEDVVVDVPFLRDPEGSANMATFNLMRELFKDVGEGQLTTLDYFSLDGTVPSDLERTKTPVHLNVYNEFGEVVGSRDTVFVTPRIGDEFGPELNKSELREKLLVNYSINQYNDWGELTDKIAQQRAISSRDIRGFRFYETWYFLKKNPCPVKKVEYVVPLVGKWDVDGNFAGLTPLSFAIGIP